MDPNFLEAWFNTTHRVLGRRLHPFCLEDALILALAESPFLLGIAPGVEYSLLDLQLAVQVCSTPSSRFLNAELRSTWWTKVRRFFWSRRCHSMDLELECQKFVSYIDDFNAGPRSWDTGDEKSLNAPWVLANATFLLRHLNFSPTEVWRMPIGMAFWYAASVSEQIGTTLELMSEEEYKVLKAAGKL